MRGTELRGARATTTCVYPRDDVNTSHESTRLLGRDGRAAQLGCSRSSLVTRSNSAQVVLLCGECGMRASTYDLSLSLYLPLPHPHSLSLPICLHFSCFLPSCLLFFLSFLIRHHSFHPFSRLPRFLPFPVLSFFLFFSFSSFADNNPLTSCLTN